MSAKQLWLVGVVFLALKVALALLGPVMVSTDNTSDAVWYLARAKMVAQTGSYLESDGTKTALFPVGFPYLLGAVSAVFGSGLRTAVLLNSLLSVAGAGLVYAIGKTLFSQKVGIAAGLVMLIAPAQYIYSQQAFSEHLFTVLLLLAVGATVLAARGRLVMALAAGVVTGLACLTRGQGLVLLVWFPLAVVMLSRRWPKAVAATGLLVVGWLAVMSPWWVRNYTAFGQFVMISNNGGKNLCVGNIGTRYARPNFEYHLSRELTGNEAQRDQIMRAEAMEHMRAHPWRFAIDAPLKIFWLYAVDAGLSFRQSVRATYGSVVGWALLGYGQVLWMMIMAAALMGLVRTRLGKEYREHNILYVLLILWGLFHTVFFGGARFNFPMFAVVTIAAAGWMFGPNQKAKLNAK